MIALLLSAFLGCSSPAPAPQTSQLVQRAGPLGSMSLPPTHYGCADHKVGSKSLMAAGLYIEENHRGMYTVCNDESISFMMMATMTLPPGLSLQQKLDDDAAASIDMGPGRWTEGTTLSGHPAQEEHRASPGLDGDNAVRRARFVLHEGKLYIAAIISEDPDSAEATALLDSVVFNDLSPAK